jgi:hypothetical protein
VSGARGGAPSWARRRPVLLLATIAASAALVVLGDLHRLEHADAIVPVLVSLQRWTPFYWDQERYGMLVPLLALPVRDPLWNLLVQRALLVAAGLGAALLLARHVLAGRDWPLAGALSAGALLVLAPAPWRFEYLGDQPYGLSLALALAGLALAEPRGAARLGRIRLAAALLLVVAAHWVNAAVGIVLLALAAARALADGADGTPAADVRRRLAVEGAMLVAGLAAGQGLLRLYPLLTGNQIRLDLGALPLAAWPRAWTAILSRAAHEAAGWGAALAVAAATGIALLAGLPPLRPRLAPALVRAGALVAAALAWALFAGTLRWVEANAFHWRYVAPSMLLVHLAALSLLAEPLARLRRVARPAGAAALALVPAAALAAYGAPSLGRVRAELDVVAGAYTADVLAARCDLVAGDYWTVWPTVWHAALVARERGLDRRVYGVTHRANPTVPFWRDRPRTSLRICRAAGDEAAAERWLRDFRLWPARAVERRGTIDVLVAAPPESGATGGTARAP